MTGAPIYLVSACCTGEEFVAAFRRYADKNGLFVPISEPFPAGRRTRFAVTLADGGVMIEGQAEILSSARTASVLHGRVGMTLRFLEPDETSKTVLAELEKARLAMKPAPPSVLPRRAEIPAEPRPVPPAPQGRIDAVNALAECVAIGDTQPLGSLPALPAGVPPRSRFVVPTIPMAGARPGSPSTAPAIGVGVTPRPPAPRGSTGPQPVVTANPAPEHNGRNQTGQVPAIGRSPVALIAPIARDSTSDTITAEVPAEPGPATSSSATLPGTPLPAAPPPVPASSAAGEIATSAHDLLIAVGRTVTIQGSGLTPVAPRPLPPRAAARSVATTAPPPVPPPAVPVPTVSAPPVASPTEPTMPPPPAPVPTVSAPPMASPTEPTMFAVQPPVPPTTTPPTANAAVMSEPAAMTRAKLEPTIERVPEPVPEPVTDAVVRTSEDDDVSARTQIHAGAPPREPARAPRAAAPVPDIEIAEPTDISLSPPVPPDASDPALSIPAAMSAITVQVAAQPVPSVDETRRKTVVGVAVVPAPSEPPRGVPTASSLRAAEEPTSSDHIVVGDSAVDAGAPTLPPDAALAPVIEELAPISNWTLPPDGAIAPVTSLPFDIALPPAAASPFDTTIPPDPMLRPPHIPGPPAEPAGAPTPVPGAALPSGDWLIAVDPRAPDGWSAPFETIPPHELVDGSPADRLPVVVGAAQPLAVTRRLDELPIIEPKVQIDPTLIEPIHVGLPAEAPAYAMDPSYQMVPVGGLPPPSSDGFVDLRYASETALRARPGRRRIIIVIVSAAVAVAIGIALLATFTGKRDAGSEPSRSIRAPASAISPPAAPATAPADAAIAAIAAIPPPPPPAPEQPVAAPCFADVSSVPPGAEIVDEHAQVIGTTPQRVTLPCNDAIELTVRKARLVAVTRSVTATPQGVKVKVTLARLAAQVRVSSTPEGATVTLNGKQLGITPTTIRVPAFDSSILMIAKDGYEIEAQKVVTKGGSNQRLHVQLKKRDRNH